MVKSIVFCLFLLCITFPFKGYCAPVIVSVVVDVSADYNCVFNSPSDTTNPPAWHPYLADTGIDVNPGDILEIGAIGTWTISGSDPWTDANGQIGRDAGGFYTSSLLGQISQTGWQTSSHGHPSAIPFFFVGTDYQSIVSEAGRLYLGFNDTDFGNNEGFVTANIHATSQSASPVPEPATLLLFGFGLSGLGFFVQFRGRIA